MGFDPRYITSSLDGILTASRAEKPCIRLSYVGDLLWDDAASPCKFTSPLLQLIIHHNATESSILRPFINHLYIRDYRIYKVSEEMTSTVKTCNVSYMKDCSFG